jgi:hypothetical protein
MAKIIIEAEINEPLSNEEYETLIDELMQLGMSNIKVKE